MKRINVGTVSGRVRTAHSASEGRQSAVLMYDQINGLTRSRNRGYLLYYADEEIYRNHRVVDMYDGVEL